jgi:hypothetical protein
MADIRETKFVSGNHIPQSPADSSNNSFNKHEKINPVPTFDETMHKDGDADVKYNEKDLGLEGGNYSMEGEESEKQVSPMRRFVQKYLIFIHAFIWMVMTGYVPHSLLRTPRLCNEPTRLTCPADGGLRASFFTDMILDG